MSQPVILSLRVAFASLQPSRASSPKMTATRRRIIQRPCSKNTLAALQATFFYFLPWTEPDRRLPIHLNVFQFLENTWCRPWCQVIYGTFREKNTIHYVCIEHVVYRMFYRNCVIKTKFFCVCILMLHPRSEEDE